MNAQTTAEKIRFLYGSPLNVVSDCLRGFLYADEGKEFIVCDFSAIEARVLAWLAGEEEVLEIFRGHGKIYEHAAAGIYKVPMEAVTKDQRQIGKVAVLALGYQGGVGAFQQMAKGYGLKIKDSEADVIKKAWREAHPHIVKYWYAVEEAVVNAVLYRGRTFAAGPEGRQVKYKVNGSFLWCLLPSGRTLAYPYPKIERIDTPWGQQKDAMTYMAMSSGVNKWERQKFYGGLGVENITQAVSRDLLAGALLRLESSGYPIVSHVHDEIVAEVEVNKGSVEEMEKIMAEGEVWSKGLPISAEGYRARRYKK